MAAGAGREQGGDEVLQCRGCVAVEGGHAGRVPLPGNLRRDDVPLVLLVPQVPPTIRHSRAAETAALHKLRRSRGDRPTGVWCCPCPPLVRHERYGHAEKRLGRRFRPTALFPCEANSITEEGRILGLPFESGNR